MKYFKKLVGERIYLSPRSLEDAEIFTEWLNDFGVTDYIGRSHTSMSLQDEKEYLEKAKKEEMAFAIIDSQKDEMIGTIGLNSIDNINRAATLGIFIGNKDYWSKGYGTEAIQLLLDFGFNYLNLNNINLSLMEFNYRAMECLKNADLKKWEEKESVDLLMVNIMIQFIWIF